MDTDTDMDMDMDGYRWMDGQMDKIDGRMAR